MGFRVEGLGFFELSLRYFSVLLSGSKDTELFLFGGFSSCKETESKNKKIRMRSEYKVQMNKDSLRSFSVLFHGPKDTAYEGGVWKVLFF